MTISAAPQDVQKKLAEKQELIDKLTKEIQATNAQLKRLTPLIPGKS